MPRLSRVTNRPRCIILDKLKTMSKFIDPCENTGQCQQQIQQNCASIFKAGGLGQFGNVQQVWGYSTEQDCLNDPRQIPLQCQPNNLQIYCQAASTLPKDSNFYQEYSACLQNPSSQPLGSPLNVPFYNCMANKNVSSANDLAACTAYAGQYLGPAYMWPQVCQKK